MKNSEFQIICIKSNTYSSSTLGGKKEDEAIKEEEEVLRGVWCEKLRISNHLY